MGSNSRNRNRNKNEQDENMELEKARLLSLAIDFGFDHNSAVKCLDRLIALYGDDGRDFITVEHCGDDFLTALAESMEALEEWDDVEEMESQACGTLTDILDHSSVANCGDDAQHNHDAAHASIPCINIIDDSPPSPKHQKKVVELDSSEDDDIDCNVSMGCRSGITQGSASSTSKKLSSPLTSKDKSRTLTYDELQALDDIELANVVIFGNRTLRPLQHEACKVALAKQDSFILMPTGGGKSLCYQVLSFS
ncbi:putative DNA helicase [Lupinus albus]|uniref:Putative DNA helicase n=1 Tax=Lupinus albus TaxID=3870 RepID=A0A6A4QE81_LUPAL|nr:putative DNA helicase [Lupinus albus]